MFVSFSEIATYYLRNLRMDDDQRLLRYLTCCFDRDRFVLFNII